MSSVVRTRSIYFSCHAKFGFLSLKLYLPSSRTPCSAKDIASPSSRCLMGGTSLCANCFIYSSKSEKEEHACAKIAYKCKRNNEQNRFTAKQIRNKLKMGPDLRMTKYSRRRNRNLKPSEQMLSDCGSVASARPCFPRRVRNGLCEDRPGSRVCG